MPSLEEIYSEKTLLLTGTTGFLGKVLLQKLLYSQPNLTRIYLLIRGKKGSKLDERFKKEVIESPCFDRLREKYGSKFDDYVNEKIKPIQGDMLKDRLGLSAADEQEVIENVNIIMNCAASIDFNARLDDAININIKGTLKILELAKKVKNLNNFTHVSTCYVNCTEKQRMIEEKIYLHNSDPEKELRDLEALPLKDLVNRTDSIIGDYPNTYTFTKNLCERLLSQRRGNLTLTILRPAVIINSYLEPYQGWVDSVAAAVALFFFCGLGVIKEIHGNPRIVGDVISVDTVSNYIIVSTAYNANSNKLAVFHSSSSHRNPVSWGQCEEECKRYWSANKASVRFSEPTIKIHNSQWNVNFNRTRRRLPAVVYNRLALMLGSKQHIKLSEKALKTLDRGYEIEKLFRFFMGHEFIFEANNVDTLMNWLNPADRKLYNIDPANLDMIRALRLSNYGLQKFILKENVEPISVESTNLFKKQSQTYFSDLKWAFKDAGQSVRKESIVNVKEEIFRSSRVQEAIYKHALSKNEFQNQDSKEFLQNKRNSQKAADEIINQMFGTFSMPIVRLEAWILTKFLKSIYEKIIVNENVFENFRKIENDLKIPIVMAPTHKSYLDFIILTYLFFNYKLKIPYVASNEVLLKMTLIPHLLRSSGAFFIKNNEMKKNPLYRSILEEFIIKILSDNNNMEFFLEGSRSRTGKILELDFSILEIIVESILDDHVNDACIVPVTINYQKVLEGDTFPEELLGEEKVEESLLRVIKTYKLLKTNFGRVYVEFAEPIYVKEYIKKQLTSTFNPYKNKPQRKELVNSLGYQIVNKLTSKLVIMSTSIVCTAILMSRKGITEDLLMKNVHWISKEVIARGHKIGGINENSPNIAVRNAVIHLDEISKTKKNVFEVQISAGEEYKKLLMLSYYRNMLTHVFLPEAFVGVAQYSFGKQLSQKEGITKERLQDKVTFLAGILKREFIMQTNIQESAGFNEVFDQMLSREILKKNGEGKIIIAPDGQKLTLLYCSLLWPLIECYWISILYLISMKYSINKTHSVDLQKLKEYIQWYAESLYEEKIVEYYESCSLETIKNAIKMFQQMKLIEIRRSKKEERVEILASEDTLTELESKLKNYLKNSKLVSSSDLARIAISGDNLLNNSKL